MLDHGGSVISFFWENEKLPKAKIKFKKRGLLNLLINITVKIVGQNNF